MAILETQALKYLTNYAAIESLLICVLRYLRSLLFENETNTKPDSARLSRVQAP